MKIAVPMESGRGEMRVSLVPETVSRLTRAGHVVTVQPDAGRAAGFVDEAYRGAGAGTAESFAGLLDDADIMTSMGTPTPEQIAHLRSGAVVIGMLQPGANHELIQGLATAGVTAFSMELVPRIARAQRLDVLSSQSSLAGYKSVLIAANALGKFFPLMMTAAGTIPPARVLVLGAGVAGLQAIATAKRLGAVVEGFDIRPETKEQVESLGATFVEAPMPDEASTEGGYAREQSEEAQRLQREVLAERVAAADVVVTTAMIPGRPAPRLVTDAMVASMRPGSVIIDLAAESGGNCELTVPGRTAERYNVQIHGPVNIPSTMPGEASVLYSRNVAGLLELLIGEDGELKIDFEDEVISGTAVTHSGKAVGAGMAGAA